jgi:DNA-binding transcriptional ArsR family regulator
MVATVATLTGSQQAAYCALMEAQLLAVTQALLDRARLRIVGLLADGRAMPVGQLAESLRLPPPTIAHHLDHLTEAGLVEARSGDQVVVYGLRLERLTELARELEGIARRERDADAPPPEAPAWASAEQARVLRSFIDGERLTSIPAQHAKRLVILRHLAETAFEPGVEYPEKEVNMRLALRHPDVASLRRYLVDAHFVSRQGGTYLLRPREDWPL